MNKRWFDAEKHQYHDGDFILPSPTKIIKDCTDKPALVQWSANQVVAWIHENCPEGANGYLVTHEDLNNARFNFREVGKKAMGIGTEVHKLIEDYLKTGKEPVVDHPEVLAAFMAFLEWQDEHQLKPTALEEICWGNHWAGTLDFRGIVDGVETVIDFKSSKKIYLADMGPQVAAYRSCHPTVKASAILRLDKETGYPEYKDISSRYEQDLKTFNLMLELFMQKHKKLAKQAGWEGT